MKTLGKLRDLHLSIVAYDGWEYVAFANSYIYFPFSYIIKKDSQNSPRLYIKIRENVLSTYDENVQKFLKENENNPILSINNSDPFDFIQNYGNEFFACKSEHCSFVLKYSSYGFYLFNMPSLLLGLARNGFRELIPSIYLD